MLARLIVVARKTREKSKKRSSGEDEKEYCTVVFARSSLVPVEKMQ
jgi:hypothetical protein